MDLPMSRNAKVRGQVAPNPPALLTGYPVLEDPRGPNAHIQQAYENMRRAGESHSMAEMLSYRAAPSSKTDDDFFRGVGTLDQQLSDNDGHYTQQIKDNYAKATGGQSPNPNYMYHQGLAQYPGDPRAFLSSAGDAKRLAEERNLSMDGFVNHKASEPESDPFSAGAMKDTDRHSIAPDLKAMIKEAYVAKDPSLKGKNLDKLLTEKHGNHVKKK